MQIRLLAGLVFMMMVIPAFSQAGDFEFNRRVYSHVEGDSWARSGMIPFELLLDKLEGADVVFLGEYHGDFYSHKMQLEIMAEMHKRNNGALRLTMEQFERDVQPVLDSFFSGNIDEEQFMADSRPWPNYDPDYRRLVEFSRNHGMQVTAANIPRPLASRVAKEGFDIAWDGYTDEERRWVAETVNREKDLYWDNFFGLMGGGHGQGMAEETVFNYFSAQCIKDDTMAESIARAREVEPLRSVVHTNGSFHSDYRLGTVSRLINRRPDDKVIVVAIRPAHSWSRATLNEETLEYGGADVPVADYIVYVEPKVEEETEAGM